MTVLNEGVIFKIHFVAILVYDVRIGSRVVSGLGGGGGCEEFGELHYEEEGDKKENNYKW